MGTLGPAILSFIERLSSLWRSKYTDIIDLGPQSVSFIGGLSSLRRLKCTSIREKVFFLFCPSERSLSEVVLYIITTACLTFYKRMMICAM